MAAMTLLDRTLAAIDEEFSAQVKSHFAGICMQVDSDGAVKAGADSAHFANGLRDVKLAYDAARAIAKDILGDAS